MEVTTGVGERAQRLLDRMRETPMRRGALSQRAGHLKRQLSRAFASEGVPAALAERVAFQIAFKIPPRDLDDESEWRAAGRILRGEVTRLTEEVRLSQSRVATALPKLSADQVVEFLNELAKTDGRIARTILYAALPGSDPLATGRRYLAEYRLVATKLRTVEPETARSVAATSFSAGAPLRKAMEHLRLRARTAAGATRR